MGISQFSIYIYIYDVVHMCPTIFKVHQFQNAVILQGEVFVPSIVPQVFPHVPIFIIIYSGFLNLPNANTDLKCFKYVFFSGKIRCFFLRIFHTQCLPRTSNISRSFPYWFHMFSYFCLTFSRSFHKLSLMFFEFSPVFPQIIPQIVPIYVSIISHKLSHRFLRSAL